MKRIGLIFSLTVLLVAMSSMFVFASGLKLDSTYPTDGQNNTSIENLGVKLYFNNEVADEETILANKECFAIKDKDGKEIPIRILTSPEQEGIVMVLADYSGDESAAENSTYTLYISGEFMDNSGSVLGKDQEISFTTLNQSRNMMINMGMMGVMFAAIFFVSQKAMKKNKNDEKDQERYVPVNPYKESKRTGKSVEEIMEEESKRKAKHDAKVAKKAAKHKTEDSDEEDEEELSVNTYKVKKCKPISTVGGKTKSGMIEKAEEKAKKEAAKKKVQNYKKK
ncbi:MAG: Ig-like domain-containing protein [Peptostreptococcaceae bacterium]|nr:Ig-like domain-containing protein [Peptostreptococcaceae bacterium]